MRRKFRICFFALLGFLTLFAIGLMMGTTLEWKWTPLILGGASLIVSVFFLVASGKGTNGLAWIAISTLISGLGCGLSASAYYLHIEVFTLTDFSVFSRQILYMGAGAVAFYILYSLSLNLRFLEKHIKWFTFPLLLGGLIVLGILWGTIDKILFSLAFFTFLMTALFIFPLIIVAKNVHQLVFHIGFAALGAVLLITIIVLIILTEADGFDVGIDSASGDQIPVENPKRSQINDSELL